MKLKVIFQTCHTVYATNGGLRPLNLSKKEIIKVCYTSLIDSIEYANLKNEVEILIIGDRLDSDMVDFFKKTSHKIINENFGIKLAYKQRLDEGIKEDDETWVYFCEDDYLHKKESILYIKDFIENNYYDKNFCIFTSDYTHRYQVRDPFYLNQHHLLLSNFCWWRQVRNITLSYICKVIDIKNNFEIFNNSALLVSDSYISENLFWNNKITCFSPIPTLTIHMHESEYPTFTHTTDVKKIIDNLSKEVN